MKHIREDAAYAEHERVINELSAKKTAIDKEINAIELKLATGSAQKPGDPVDDALQLQPGIATQHNSDADKLPVLRAQSEQIHKAIALKSEAMNGARRAASYRVFAANADVYIKHTAELLVLVDQIVELNKALVTDQKALYGMGCTDLPEVQFPNYGLSEQLAVHWRSDLNDQLQLLKHITRVTS